VIDAIISRCKSAIAALTAEHQLTIEAFGLVLRELHAIRSLAKRDARLRSLSDACRAFASDHPAAKSEFEAVAHDIDALIRAERKIK
jgi:hypothetical protein